MQEPQPCGYPLRLSVKAAPFPIGSCYMQFVMINSYCYMFSKGSSLKLNNNCCLVVMMMTTRRNNINNTRLSFPLCFMKAWPSFQYNPIRPKHSTEKDRNTEKSLISYN